MRAECRNLSQPVTIGKVSREVNIDSKLQRMNRLLHEERERKENYLGGATQLAKARVGHTRSTIHTDDWEAKQATDWSSGL